MSVSPDWRTLTDASNGSSRMPHEVLTVPPQCDRVDPCGSRTTRERCRASVPASDMDARSFGGPAPGGIGSRNAAVEARVSGCGALVERAAAQFRLLNRRRHVRLVEGADVGPGRDDLIDPVQDLVGEDGIHAREEVLRVGDASRIGLEPSLHARPSCHARDMADFTVETSNGVVTSYSGVEARHDLNAQSGVLVVWDGKGKRLKFSPCGWLSVVDEDQAIAHKPLGVEMV